MNGVVIWGSRLFGSMLSVLSTEKGVVSHVQSIDVNHDSVRPQIVFNSGADLQFDLEHTKHMKKTTLSVQAVGGLVRVTNQGY